MVISSSAVGMAAKTTQSVKYSQTNESLASAVGTGEKRYASNSFNAEYERTIESSLYEETAVGKRQSEEKQTVILLRKVMKSCWLIMDLLVRLKRRKKSLCKVF